MIDKEYNKNRCLECADKNDCGYCQAAYEEPGGIKEVGGFFGGWVADPDGYTVMRYAQRNVLDQLAELCIKGEV